MSFFKSLCCEAGSQLVSRQVCRLFALIQFDPPHKADAVKFEGEAIVRATHQLHILNFPRNLCRSKQNPRNRRVDQYGDEPYKQRPQPQARQVVSQDIRGTRKVACYVIA